MRDRHSLLPNDLDRLVLPPGSQGTFLGALVGRGRRQIPLLLSIWIFDPKQQGYGAIVGQDVAIGRIQNGIVDVRDEHALAQITPARRYAWRHPADGMLSHVTRPSLNS